MSFDKEGTYATSESPALLGLLLLSLPAAGRMPDGRYMEELFHSCPACPRNTPPSPASWISCCRRGYEYMAPTSGRNIQSLQMVDIDGDRQDEALAFFPPQQR